jgi:hypothetical protein
MRPSPWRSSAAAARRRTVARVRRLALHALRPAALLAAPLLILLLAACGSSSTGAAGTHRPTGTAAPPPTSAPTTWATATARAQLPVTIPPTGAPGATCVQGWHSVQPDSDDYATAAALLPQIAGAKVVRVFTGPLPGTGTGLHVYARTDDARLLAVQTGDGPPVVFTAAGDTGNWRPADWHRTGAAPEPSASAAALLPASQAGCLDGS